MDKIVKRDQGAEKRFRKLLYKKYGKYINRKPIDIPDKHKCTMTGALRCFKKIEKRDKEGNKIKGSVKRCGAIAKKGSLFCELHGGGNSTAMTTGEYSLTAKMYRGAFSHKFDDVLIAFLTDPAITDLKPELASLRTILRQYIKRLAEAEPKSPKIFIKVAQNIVNSEDDNDLDKYHALKVLIEEQESLTDGHCIDRISRVVESIGKMVDRIYKISNKEEFILTPDGLKIFLRAIIDIITQTIENNELQKEIKSKLLNISVLTGGDIANYDEKKFFKEGIIDVNSKEIKDTNKD